MKAHKRCGTTLPEAALRAVRVRRAADFVNKILRGTTPADIPVEQPTKFELVSTSRPRRPLGLVFPLPMLGRADG
jgi:ABC-type uncharacterized transport system substrate-binding protein